MAMEFGDIARRCFLFKADALPPSRDTRVDGHVTSNKICFAKTAKTGDAWFLSNPMRYLGNSNCDLHISTTPDPPVSLTTFSDIGRLPEFKMADSKPEA
jgi:hypothetical protein